MNKLGWSALLVLTSACSAPLGEDVQVVRDNLTVGAYNFRTATASPGKCLDVAGGGSADGTNVQLWTCNGTGAQLWQPVATTLVGGTYALGTLGGSSSCVDIWGGGTADGTNIDEWQCSGLWNQAFRVDSLGNGTVRLVNPTSNKCVDVDLAGSADGTNIKLYTCNGSGAQSFRVND